MSGELQQQRRDGTWKTLGQIKDLDLSSRTVVAPAGQHFVDIRKKGDVLWTRVGQTQSRESPISFRINDLIPDVTYEIRFICSK